MSRQEAGRRGGRKTSQERGPDFYREIGKRGGQEAHRRGTAHEFTPYEAREAGRRGGKASHDRGRKKISDVEEW